MKKIFSILFIALLIFAGCSKDENPVDNEPNSDIPSNPTNITVPQPQKNNLSPTATFTNNSSNPERIMMNLSGMLNPNTNDPLTLTGNDNIFVEEDGVVQGIKVTKVGQNNVLKADIVFTVDISGSMGEEADSIAASIINFANTLENSGLDVQFGCVGYYGDIRGAINFTDAQSLEDYLNRDTGTDRAEGFSGPDSAALDDSASTFAQFHGSSDENGVVGILFAREFFNWRSDAQKVYVNFTDEPVQPSGMQEWSVPYACSVIGGEATVHTVWSASDTTDSWQPLQNERPWKLSECTGGTTVLIPTNAEGLDLSQLPVTGALSNSYLVEFVSGDPNATHTVTITVYTSDADGRRMYQNISY